MTLPTVSILIPARNEEDYIEPCLASLQAQSYPSDLIELLVLDGQSSDGTRAIVEQIAAVDRRVRLVANPDRSPSSAMNVGISAATGTIIVRADAHAIYHQDYVRLSVMHLVEGRADNVGGLQRGAGQGTLSRALAAAMNTPLGSGCAAYRQAKRACYADTVWLGAWYRAKLIELGGFDVTMFANQDYELNSRLRARGGRVLVDPAIQSWYFPRGSLGALGRQYFRYGRAKARHRALHPGSMRLRQRIPAVFALALAASLLVAPLSVVPLAVLAGAYAVALLVGAMQVWLKAGLVCALVAPCLYACMHLAWGGGFFYELAKQRRERALAAGAAPAAEPGDRA